MTIDRGLIERRARQSAARTVALSLPGPCIDADVRARVARYRWRQMRIASRSCERWAHVQDRLTARWLLCQDHERARGLARVPSEAWCWVRMYLDRPIAGPVGRLP